MCIGNWLKIPLLFCALTATQAMAAERARPASWQPEGVGNDRGAKALAHAGGGLADGSDISAVDASYAALSLTPRYELATGAGLGPTGRWVLRSSVLDSRTGPVALGLSYSRSHDEFLPEDADLPGWKTPEETLVTPLTRQAIVAGLALPLGASRRLSLGVQGRYDDAKAEDDTRTHSYDVGASVAGQPIPSLTLAAAAHNLRGEATGRDRALEVAARWAPGPYFGLEGSAAAPLPAGVFSGQAAWAETRLQAGLDVGLVEGLSLRGGGSFVPESQAWQAAGGIGLGTPKYGVEYGIRVPLDDTGAWQQAIELRAAF